MKIECCKCKKNLSKQTIVFNVNNNKRIVEELKVKNISIELTRLYCDSCIIEFDNKFIDIDELPINRQDK